RANPRWRHHSTASLLATVPIVFRLSGPLALRPSLGASARGLPLGRDAGAPLIPPRPRALAIARAMSAHAGAGGSPDAGPEEHERGAPAPPGRAGTPPQPRSVPDTVRARPTGSPRPQRGRETF